MDYFLSTLPRWVIATVVLVVGMLFIVVYDPPRDICDVQIDILKSSHGKVLFAQQKKNLELPAKFLDLMTNCRNSAAPGGCLKLFEFLRLYVIDFRKVPDQCMAKINEEAIFVRALREPLELLVKIPWRGIAATNFVEREGWYDHSELGLFCRLKAELIRVWGNEQWTGYQEQLLRELGRDKGLSREQVWQRSILSTSCSFYTDRSCKLCQPVLGLLFGVPTKRKSGS